MSLIELLLHYGWHFVHSDEWITPDDRVVDGSEAFGWAFMRAYTSNDAKLTAAALACGPEETA